MASSSIVRARLDAKTRQALEHFRIAAGLPTESAALRVLISLGLEREGGFQRTFVKSCYAEATINAQRSLRAKIETAIQQTLGEFVG